MESNADFYMQLGLLATKFSSLEYHCEAILSAIIAKEDDFLGATILEGVSFYRKISLLKDVAKLRSGYDEEIWQLANAMNDVRRQRNFFIHGLWNEPVRGDSGYSVVVFERKVTRQKEKHSTTWRLAKPREFTKGQLERLDTRVDLMISQAKKLHEKVIDEI